MCAVDGNKSEQIPYTAFQIGKLAAMVAAENMRQRARIYDFRCYDGNRFWLKYKVFASGTVYEIVPENTKATEAALTFALEDMRKAIKEVA